MLIAFANADGGAVFLGVDNSGAVTGIPSARLDAVERWIANVATHNCEPPIRPVLRKTLLPASHSGERYVILAEVPRGLFVHRTSQGRYYVRVGSTKRDLTPAEVARLFQQRGREYVFDEQAVLAAAVDHLNRHRLEALVGRSPTIPWLDLLRNTRVTAPDEHGVDRPTAAGLLTFGNEPTEFLPSASIEAACYRRDSLVDVEGVRCVNPGCNGLDPLAREHSGSKIRLFLFADKVTRQRRSLNDTRGSTAAAWSIRSVSTSTISMPSSTQPFTVTSCTSSSTDGTTATLPTCCTTRARIASSDSR